MQNVHRYQGEFEPTENVKMIALQFIYSIQLCIYFNNIKASYYIDAAL